MALILKFALAVLLVMFLLDATDSKAANAGDARSFEVSQIEDGEKDAVATATEIAKNLMKESGQVIPFSNENFEALVETYQHVNTTHYHFEKTGVTERLVVTFDDANKINVRSLRIQESREAFFKRCQRENRVCMYIPKKGKMK